MAEIQQSHLPNSNPGDERSPDSTFTPVEVDDELHALLSTDAEDDPDAILREQFLRPTDNGPSDGEVADWFSTLPPDDQDFFTLMRDAEIHRSNTADDVEIKLRGSMPEELFAARLPESLESRIYGMPYALGVNQSEGISHVDDARQRLTDDGGITLANHNLGGRFKFIDTTTADVTPQLTEDLLTRGYYNNPLIGRFIIAIPQLASESAQSLTPAEVIEHLGTDGPYPTDAFKDIEGAHGKTSVVSSKYVVGFIEGDGTYYDNTNFGLNDKPNLQSGTANEPEPHAEEWL